MYMRFVQVKYKPDTIEKIQKTYTDKIIPRLKETPGCLFAGLMKGESQENEGISMTLWNSRENAEAYEQSGLYQELLGMLRPYLEDSSEWKIQLTKDLELEYQPVAEEPVIKSFDLVAQTNNKILDKNKSDLLYLRILSLKIKPGKMEEFETIYKEDIIPVLQTEKGCRYAFLTENVEGKNEAISITVWDSKQDAINYEQEGHFKKLLKKAEHTFGELFQWKMALEKEFSSKVSTTEDLSVEYYNVVTGKSFQ